MTYKSVWEEQADCDLKNIPSDIALKIYNRVEKYLTIAPKELGKALTGNYNGSYRYRYGDYRVIYKILDKENTIVILVVGHRKDVY